MPRTIRLVVLHIAMLLGSSAGSALHAAPSPGLTAHVERSGYVETGRYEEVVTLCEAFADAYPEAVRCFDFGTSPEGRPMKALAATRTGALIPGDARARKLPVVLVQGGIHPGEADGKDAGFLALRDVLAGTAAPGSLEQFMSPAPGAGGPVAAGTARHPGGQPVHTIAQPAERLVMGLFEPEATGSHAAWGSFNNHYERKEYMDAYVAEAVAREMFEADPSLRAEFERRLREDHAFSSSPRARLDYRRHPAWDERLGLYPVYRTDWKP